MDFIYTLDLFNEKAFLIFLVIGPLICPYQQKFKYFY